jgi:hypothetical protein
MTERENMYDADEEDGKGKRKGSGKRKETADHTDNADEKLKNNGDDEE